jgi:tRNA-splicing ligase RtcB
MPHTTLPGIVCWASELQDEAREQVERTARLPIIYQHVAVMPDAHWGMGATVGSVIATKSAVIPAAVGVDIGCGMCAAPTTLDASDLPDSLTQLRLDIEEAIPVGFSENNDKVAEGIWEAFDLWHLDTQLYNIQETTPGARQKTLGKHQRQMGTLGGGNHFIELCLDEKDRVWIMLHSGSRNIGKVIADVFISQAKEACKMWQIPLEDPDLAWLPEGTAQFENYWEAVDWAQRYAFANRQVMMARIIRILGAHFGACGIYEEALVNCHHNYVARENHMGHNVIVTRKGAIRAREGDMGIIPGSMGTRSYIVRGKGNPLSFHSCSHGAGRRMGRKAAKRTYNLDDFHEQTQGVECRKDEDVIDEIPGAYKDIDQVMADQTDLVEPVHTLKQVLCVKG